MFRNPDFDMHIAMLSVFGSTPPLPPLQVSFTTVYEKVTADLLHLCATRVQWRAYSVYESSFPTRTVVIIKLYKFGVIGGRGRGGNDEK